MRKLPLTEATLKSFDQAKQGARDAADCSRLPVWWLIKTAQAQILGAAGASSGTGGTRTRRSVSQGSRRLAWSLDDP
ncbi:MAG: hypothetical protein Q8R72_01555 [Hylemonella sp.]|nr:hypothetical protein [Hylemonella sp.]